MKTKGPAIPALLTSIGVLALLISSGAWPTTAWSNLAVRAAPPPASGEDRNAAAGSLSTSLRVRSEDTCDLNYNLLYGTLLGGKDGTDDGKGIVVDEAGNAYVTGHTDSLDVPDSPDPPLCVPQPAPTYLGCIFVVKTSADGTPSGYTALLGEYMTGNWSFGGIAVDDDGNAYVTYRAAGAGRVAHLSTEGTVIEDQLHSWSDGRTIAIDNERRIYLTGKNMVSRSDVSISLEEGGGGWGIVVDTSGNIFVTSDEVGAVVKVDANNEVVGSWTTRADGTDWGIDLDREGNVYVVNVIDRQTQVIKFDNDGGEIYRVDLCSGCRGRDIAVDGAGNAFVTGYTATDAFVARVNREGTESACAIIGGSNDEPWEGDRGHGIAVDGMGHVWVTGTTWSSDFPRTTGTYSDEGDAFVIKLELQEPPTPTRGRVLLQGRDDHAGTGVYLREDDCGGLPSGAPSTVTDANGDFEIPPPGRSYSCLQAFTPGYLIGQKDSPEGELGVITLPGGDVTQDSVIDIADLLYIAGRFHRSDAPVADLSGDGWVNVCDLAIASGNYGTNGPVTDWQ